MIAGTDYFFLKKFYSDPCQLIKLIKVAILVEHQGAVGLNEDHVLQAHSAPIRQVDARFHGG